MARKVFISFLGFTNYAECHYCCDSYKSSKVRFIQEATLDYLSQKEKWTSNDTAIILLTKDAESANWNDNGHKDSNTKTTIQQEGLESRLRHMELGIKIQPVKELPNGNNTEEIWSIFEKLFDELRDGDELYFDLTHGFRYLPMLVLVMGNYSKFLKKTTVKSVTYGNFEGRNRETNEALIVNLMPLVSLQDWAFEAANYLQNGYVDGLSELTKKEINPILAQSKGQDDDAQTLKKYTGLLKEVIEERLMCRGVSIIKSNKFAELRKYADKAQCVKTIAPLAPIIGKINASFNSFEIKENVNNGFAAARWCLDCHLYQQSVTILMETIVTLVCIEHNINWQLHSERELVNKAFDILNNNRPENEWAFSTNLTEEEIKENKKTIKRLIECSTVNDLASTFEVCTGIRNDYNHAGMRDNPSSTFKLRSNIEERVNKIEEYIQTRRMSNKEH